MDAQQQPQPTVQPAAGQPGAPYAAANVELPCMQESMIECSETIGLVIFILNIISCPLGTWISSCVDRKGCNMSAFCAGML